MTGLLGGLRVLDLTQIRAGPKAARWLADAGAEVIKVESLRRPDTGRRMHSAPGGPAAEGPTSETEQRATNRRGFDQLNRNKLGLALDITTPEGAQLFKRLVQISDVVMDNFSYGVMDRLGLGYAELRKVRPDIIMLSMPAFGRGGPDESYIAYGWGQEHMAGLSAMTGYEGGPPLKLGTIVGDPLNGVHAAAAIMAALVHRARTGQGQWIDFSQLESLVALRGDAVLDFTVNGRNPVRRGNRHATWAPHGVYRCQGDDHWVAVAVTSDAEWAALSTAIGRPELQTDPRFAHSPDRHMHQRTLDPIIEAWTSQRTHYEAMEILQRAGAPAAAVLDQDEMLLSPQSEARGFLASYVHPDGVYHFYINTPWQFSRAQTGVRRPAPLLGEHNDYVLGELLGLSREERARLEAAGITATFSTGSGVAGASVV